MKTENPYKNNPDYLTFGQSVELLGIYPPTFRRYAERFGIKGKRCGTYNYFLRSEVEFLNMALNGNAVDILIKALEFRTGKHVRLI